MLVQGTAPFGSHGSQSLQEKDFTKMSKKNSLELGLQSQIGMLLEIVGNLNTKKNLTGTAERLEVLDGFVFSIPVDSIEVQKIQLQMVRILQVVENLPNNNPFDIRRRDNFLEEFSSLNLPHIGSTTLQSIVLQMNMLLGVIKDLHNVHKSEIPGYHMIERDNLLMKINEIAEANLRNILASAKVAQSSTEEDKSPLKLEIYNKASQFPDTQSKMEDLTKCALKFVDDLKQLVSTLNVEAKTTL
ncbi:MAG: hypothetical protein H0U49_10295 [Parachlamydiaceae bacterium]|nr:hypothetical protein [Parachlamydiaceae bacterium]